MPRRSLGWSRELDSHGIECPRLTPWRSMMVVSEEPGLPPLGTMFWAEAVMVFVYGGGRPNRIIQRPPRSAGMWRWCLLVWRPATPWAERLHVLSTHLAPTAEPVPRPGYFGAATHGSVTAPAAPVVPDRRMDAEARSFLLDPVDDP